MMLKLKLENANCVLKRQEVEVNATEIRLTFGVGIITKIISLKEIKSVASIKKQILVWLGNSINPSWLALEYCWI